MRQKIFFIVLGAFLFFGVIVATGLDNPNIETLSVEEIALNAEYVVLSVGESDVLLANVYPFNANNQNILWSSSDSSVVSVNNGIITAQKEGNVQVFAVSEEGNFSDYCYVDVIN